MSERLKKVLYSAVTLLLLAGGGYEIHTIHDENVTLSELKHKSNEYELDESHLVKANSQPKYVVNSEGHMDYTAKHTIATIKDLFADMNTYKNAKQYNNARQDAMQVIKDKQFFKTFMKNDGEALAVQHDKSKNDGTQVYEVSPGQYLVITSYYMYHNPKDFDHPSMLTPSKATFLFSGDSLRISEAKPLTGLSSNG